METERLIIDSVRETDEEDNSCEIGYGIGSGFFMNIDGKDYGNNACIQAKENGTDN